IREEDDYQQWPADLWFETCEDLVDALTAFH
ncbi:MAG: phosphoglycolate phosphatase, partial [Halomonas venusta]|nr:phosphoglycolate phosphatase [Halomonas venusta]